MAQTTLKDWAIAAIIMQNNIFIAAPIAYKTHKQTQASKRDEGSHTWHNS